MKAKILVAEDDKSFGDLIREILQKEDYEVFVKENGQLVWETLQKESIDLAIFDTNMPEMNGLQLSKKVKGDKKYKHLPVLVLTGKSIVDNQVKDYKTVVDGYIVKPFDQDEFIKKIQEALEKSAKSPGQLSDLKKLRPDLSVPEVMTMNILQEILKPRNLLIGMALFVIGLYLFSRTNFAYARFLREYCSILFP
jgi:DNA-binding response OmpR family regulator